MTHDDYVNALGSMRLVTTIECSGVTGLFRIQVRCMLCNDPVYLAVTKSKPEIEPAGFAFLAAHGEFHGMKPGIVARTMHPTPEALKKMFDACESHFGVGDGEPIFDGIVY